MKIEFTLALICVTVHSLDNDLEESRKNFALNTYNLCSDYVKSFKCMSVCKSIGFQIFRMDRKCKCSCHGMKTSTILPFFKWRTNGTTRKVPRTYSPKLYQIVGTLSPPPVHVEEETTDADVTIPAEAPEAPEAPKAPKAPDAPEAPESVTTTKGEVATTTGKVAGEDATATAAG